VNSTFDDYQAGPATIQIPTGAANGSKLEITCSFTGMEGKRLILESPERISMSTPVSVEYNDAMFLGEVMLCRQDSSGEYRVEINVEQILTGLQSLISLRAGLLGASGIPDPTPVKIPAFIPAAVQNRTIFP
jgi:hypothetical protein